MITSPKQTTHPTDIVTKLITMLCAAMLLTACSQGKSVNKLQKEFDQYSYSEYVLANLRIQVPIKNTDAVASIPPLNIKKSTVRVTLNSNSAIVNNGLFKPSNTHYSTAALAKKAPLNSVLNIALKRNLSIKSAKQQLQANLAKYQQVAFLSDTLKQYAAFTHSIALIGSAKQKIEVAYPTPGFNAIKSSIIDESVKYARLKLKQTTQDVITRVRITYLELQTTYKEIRLLEQLNKQYLSLKQELQNNYVANTAELGVILQTDIDIASNKNKQKLAKDKLNAQQAQLNASLNIPASTRFNNLDKLVDTKLFSNNAKDTNPASLKTKAHTQRVEIALLETELAKMQQLIQLSEKRLYTDLDAGFSRTQNKKFNTKPKIRSNNYFAKNDAYLTETRQKAKSLESKIGALKNNTSSDLQQHLSAYQSHRSTYKIYQNTIIPKAKAALDIAKNAFEAGSGNNVSIIKATMAILKYRLLLLKALKGMQLRQSKLERLSGMSQK